MRIRTFGALLLALALPISSCSDNGIVDPKSPAPALLSVAPAAPKMVISQVYGAGGNSGATLNADYVELFNAGTATASLSGWSVQYASATGTGNFGSSASQLVALSGSVAPGQYYLVKLGGGANGAPLPASDATGTIAMAAGAGKVALSDQATSIGCNGGSNPCTPAQLARIVDLVGYGSANFHEGSGPAPTLSTTLAGFRANNGCTDTNDNSDDFSTGTPAPRNSSTTVPACAGGGEAAVVDRVVVTPEEATVELGTSTQFTAKAYDAADQEIAAGFTWSSSNANASVSSTGIATGEAAGDALIIATSANGKADTATLHVEAPAPQPAVRFSEIHYDNVGTDFGEALEIEGPAGTDVTGWRIVLYNGNGGVVYGEERVFDGLIPAITACSGRGVLVVTYPQDGLQNGAPDGMALLDAAGTVVEFLSYEGLFTATNGPAEGMTSRDIGVSQTSAPVGQSLQRNSVGTSWASNAASFGVCNGTGVTPPPFPNSISFSGRVPADPPLPVGFEDQLFATLRDGSGSTVPTTFVWSSETPAIASIDQNGVMRALSAGTALVRATAEDGTTRRYSLPTHVATASASADYAGNAEFGEPTDATPADEFIIRRDQLITSFNPTTGIPNWVAYEIDASHFGPQDRCDCFTYDPELPAAGRYTTADYTGAGAFHGYGIDRGHLARSFDRTAGSLDNAHTYYFSNIIPQAADNNQGPWAQMENYLGNLVRFQNKEVYVIAGPAGNKGTIKDEGKMVIPEHTWKVAVIMLKDQGIEHVNSHGDVEVIAVIMPNEAGIRSVPWQSYRRTVDEVEALTGYDLLALLRDDIEIAVESNTKPPVAAVDGPYTAIEGESIAMSATMSSDPDGDALTFAWRFGDGGTASGVNVSHTYTSGGTFVVRLIATDTRALSDTVTTTATIATWSQATGSAAAALGQLASAGKINKGIANSLEVKLAAAENQFRRGNNTAAVNQLEAFIHELDALIQSGRLLAADAAQLRMLVTRIIAAAS
ncbi:MAG: DNA/RNA non-specific endonuclease [Gemmatimonadaceae bacterium]|nr:DNA/RNA non-specific endonuclease [Gemmatimonadaceae bacterium]